MSDTNNRPNADGSLRGDDKPMPNKGTGTNVTDTYGADISPTAKNRMGSIAGSTKSDPAEQCFTKDQRI